MREGQGAGQMGILEEASDSARAEGVRARDQKPVRDYSFCLFWACSLSAPSCSVKSLGRGKSVWGTFGTWVGDIKRSHPLWGRELLWPKGPGFSDQLLLYLQVSPAGSDREGRAITDQFSVLNLYCFQNWPRISQTLDA